MSVATPTVVRLQDQHDVSVSLGAGVDEYALTYDHDTAKFVLRAPATPFDGTPYALLAGRAGGQTLYGGTAANDDITIHGTSNATRTTSYVLLQPTAGNVGIGTAAPTQMLQIAGNIRLNVTGSWIGDSSANAFLPYANAGGDAQINSAANIVLNATGNVGIGTTAPATLLHGLLTSAATNAVTNVVTIGHDTSGTAAAGFGAGLLFQLESSTTAAQDAARITALWTDATHATRTSKLTFSTVNSAAALASAMTILGNGNVGLGTDTPETRLEIREASGVIQFRSTNQAVTQDFVLGKIQFYTTDVSTNAAGVGAYIAAVGGDGYGEETDLVFATTKNPGATPAQERMRILGELGYVGILDPAPAEALDVTGNINTTGVVKVDDVQVLSNRVIDARCADVANSGDATTDGLIDALRDAMVAHGLIAAA